MTWRLRTVQQTDIPVDYKIICTSIYFILADVISICVEVAGLFAPFNRIALNKGKAIPVTGRGGP
jgi:hypothetical protein